MLQTASENDSGRKDFVEQWVMSWNWRSPTDHVANDRKFEDGWEASASRGRYTKDYKNDAYYAAGYSRSYRLKM